MQQNVVCRLTASLPAALATIGVHGPDAIRLVGAMIRSSHCLTQPGAPLLPAEVGVSETRIRFAHWPLLGGSAFEQVVLCIVDYQTVEINCHGGIAVSNEIVDSLKSVGCQVVDWPTWWREIEMPQPYHKKHNRFGPESGCGGQSSQLDGSIGSMQAAEISIRVAAEQALLSTTSQRCAGILLDQLAGSLWKSLCRIDALLRQNDTSTAKELVQQLLRWSDLGLHLDQAWNVVLAGPPNVGKSSLLNALSGQQHSIVHHQAGTTRDWIEVSSQIDGWPINLTDTAGIRETSEAVESEGVLRARQKLLEADLVVIVVDSSIGWKREHDQLLQACCQRHCRPRFLVAWNKADLLPNNASMNFTDQPSIFLTGTESVTSIGCSAFDDTGDLWNAIAKILVPDSPSPGTAVPFTKQQVDMLEQVAGFLSQPEAVIELDWKQIVEDCIMRKLSTGDL